MAQAVGDLARSFCGAVDTGVDDPLIDAVPENARGAVDQRLDEQRAVNLVD